MTTTREQRVSAFMAAGGKEGFKKTGTYDASYVNNLVEECDELREAVVDYCSAQDEDTRANLCKEWADVQVVLSNIAVWLDIPADAAFNKVHDNNMTKVVGGKVILREDGKIMKPEGYVKPDMRGL